MRSIWFLLVTVVATVWSVPLESGSKLTFNQILTSTDANSSKNSILEGVLWDLLDELRDIILNGQGIIPPLDPLHIPSLAVDDSIIPFPGARVELKNASVRNLAKFEVDRLSVNLAGAFPLRYRVRLDIRIPTIEADADQYDLDISALGFNIFGAGSIKLKVIEPKINADLVVNAALLGGTFLSISQCTVQFVLAGFEPVITGLFNHEASSAFVSLFLKDFVPTVVEVYEPEITNFLSTNIQEIGNEILADLNLADLLP